MLANKRSSGAEVTKSNTESNGFILVCASIKNRILLLLKTSTPKERENNYRILKIYGVDDAFLNFFKKNITFLKTFKKQSE